MHRHKHENVVDFKRWFCVFALVRNTAIFRMPPKNSTIPMLSGKASYGSYQNGNTIFENLTTDLALPARGRFLGFHSFSTQHRRLILEE